MYELIHTQIFTLYSFLISAIYFLGSGKYSGSKVKEHQSNCFIQLQQSASRDLIPKTYKQSRWNTLTGQFRSFIPLRKLDTVAWSYEVKKDVER